ncbi:urease accessory protein UreD [Pseudoroseicyclus sp. CLL3-39]|uniref:Urease accessory protein UreD n=2 Tax=Pseudoroseicyclus tamaricis TaxID=2705421 RepID=A0A6B2JMU5_9RHOB|nr:urease accessory protein UreD [Pseudoroseicyclus tamaricis]
MSATRPALAEASSGQPRAQGAVTLAVARRGAATRLVGLRQEGALKLLFPQPRPGPMQAVLLNTSGGLTGGDRMRVSAEVGPGAALTLTTQAAERAYRAAEGVARSEVQVRMGAGAKLHWLPQETILFEGAALERRLILEMEEGAEALIAEPVIFGRREMGEALARATFRDAWDVRLCGRLVFADALRFGPDAAATLASPALGAGAGAMASLLLVAPHAEGKLAPLREALGPRGGASLVREGVLFARLLAEDGFRLRHHLEPALALLAGAALPKVWRL